MRMGIYSKSLSLTIVVLFMFSSVCSAVPAVTVANAKPQVESVQAKLVDNMALQSTLQAMGDNKVAEQFGRTIQNHKDQFVALLKLATGKKYDKDADAVAEIEALWKKNLALTGADQPSTIATVQGFAKELAGVTVAGNEVSLNVGGAKFTVIVENNILTDKSKQALIDKVTGKTESTGVARWADDTETLMQVMAEQLAVSRELTHAEAAKVEAAIKDYQAKLNEKFPVAADSPEQALLTAANEYFDDNFEKLGAKAVYAPTNLTVGQAEGYNELVDRQHRAHVLIKMLRQGRIKSIEDRVEGEHQYSFNVTGEDAEGNFIIGLGRGILAQENQELVNQNVIHEGVSIQNETNFADHLSVIEKYQAPVYGQEVMDRVATGMHDYKQTRLATVKAANLIDGTKQELTLAEAQEVAQEVGIERGEMAEADFAKLMTDVSRTRQVEEVQMPIIARGRLHDKQLSRAFAATEEDAGTSVTSLAAMTTEVLRQMITEGKMISLTQNVSTALDEKGDLMPNTVLGHLVTIAQNVGEGEVVQGKPKPLQIINVADDTTVRRLERLFNVAGVGHLFNVTKGNEQSLLNAEAGITPQSLSIIHTAEERGQMQNLAGAFYLPLETEVLNAMLEGKLVDNKTYNISAVLMAAMAQDITRLGLSQAAQQAFAQARANGQSYFADVPTVTVASEEAYRASAAEFKIMLVRWSQA